MQCLKILLACFHCKNISSSSSSLRVPRRFIPLAQERCPALQRQGRAGAERVVTFLSGFSSVAFSASFSFCSKSRPLAPRRQAAEQTEGKPFRNYQCGCFKSRCFIFCFAICISVAFFLKPKKPSRGLTTLQPPPSPASTDIMLAGDGSCNTKYLEMCLIGKVYLSATACKSELG